MYLFFFLTKTNRDQIALLLATSGISGSEWFWKGNIKYLLILAPLHLAPPPRFFGGAEDGQEGAVKGPKIRLIK